MEILQEKFGFKIQYGKWDKQRSLPMYIYSEYDFNELNIEGIPCILIYTKSELGTISYIKKQIQAIQALDNKPVIIRVDGISQYRRKAMIENGIPFITSKQAYLPFLGTILTQNDVAPDSIEKFTYATQQLVLLYLYSEEKELYISDATKALSLTAMTLSRAVKQLEASNCFDIYKDGVNKVIKSRYNKRELFENIKRYLKSPVQGYGYVAKELLEKEYPLAGESALSEFTMLSAPRLATYAAYGREFDKRLLSNDLIDRDKQIVMEIWGYDPKKFSNEKTVDKISLAISLNENIDERVEGGVEELIEEMWGKSNG